MSVIPITLFFSLLLASTFVILFAREHARREFASAERDSLLPLADETAQPLRAAVPATAATRAAGSAAAGSDRNAGPAPDHDPAADSSGTCGCRAGLRPPCAGCLRTPAGRSATSAHS